MSTQHSPFEFESDWQVRSIDVPPGYRVTDVDDCAAWIGDDNHLGGRIVVSRLDLMNVFVDAALNGHPAVSDGAIQKAAIGSATWFIAIPDPFNLIEDSFFAIQVVDDIAIGAYGVGTGWDVTDLKQFLAGITRSV